MVQLRGLIAFGQPDRTLQEPPMPIEVAPDPLAPPTERLAAPPVLFSPSDFTDAAGAYTHFRHCPDGDVDAWVEAFADDAGPHPPVPHRPGGGGGPRGRGVPRRRRARRTLPRPPPQESRRRVTAGGRHRPDARGRGRIRRLPARP